MPRLTVILKHGFQDDHAIVSVNGAPILDREGLTTRTTVDRATAVDHDVPAGLITLDVAVPTRGITRSLRVDLRDRKTVLVSIAPGPRLRIDIVEGIVGDA